MICVQKITRTNNTKIKVYYQIKISGDLAEKIENNSLDIIKIITLYLDRCN